MLFLGFNYYCNEISLLQDLRNASNQTFVNLWVRSHELCELLAFLSHLKCLCYYSYIHTVHAWKLTSLKKFPSETSFSKISTASVVLWTLNVSLCLVMLKRSLPIGPADVGVMVSYKTVSLTIKKYQEEFCLLCNANKMLLQARNFYAGNPSEANYRFIEIKSE